MKSFFQNIKNLLANKRYRSITILGIYLIFFCFVFILFSTASKSPNVVTKEPLEVFSTLKNYQYTIDDITVLVNNESITYLNEKHPFNSIPTELEKYDIDYFTPNTIYNLIKNGILQSTNFVEKSDTYLIEMDNIDTDTLEDKGFGKFTITVYKKTSIDKVLIDLTSYNGYKYIIEV